MENLFETLKENVSESCFNDIMNMVEERINEVSKDWLDKKEEHANTEKNRTIGAHGKSMTPENPEGDPELFKKRQDSIERIKKFRKKKTEYLENKRNREDGTQG